MSHLPFDIVQILNLRAAQCVCVYVRTHCVVSQPCGPLHTLRFTWEGPRAACRKASSSYFPGKCHHNQSHFSPPPPPPPLLFHTSPLPPSLSPCTACQNSHISPEDKMPWRPQEELCCVPALPSAFCSS